MQRHLLVDWRNCLTCTRSSSDSSDKKSCYLNWFVFWRYRNDDTDEGYDDTGKVFKLDVPAFSRSPWQRSFKAHSKQNDFGLIMPHRITRINFFHWTRSCWIFDLKRRSGTSFWSRTINILRDTMLANDDCDELNFVIPRLFALIKHGKIGS